MGVAYNSSIVTNGLALNIDFANYKSYIGSGSIVSDTVISSSGTLVNPSYYSYDSATKSINFTRDSASVIGGYFTTTLSGALTSSSFLYSDHTMEIMARINDYAPSNINANETDNILMGYQGYHAGFHYYVGTFMYGIWNGTSFPNISFSSRPASGAWFHAVATRSGSTTTLYLNGNVSTSLSYSTASGNPGTTNIFKFGAGNPGTGPFASYAKCNVAFGRLYTRALTADEVLKNFNASRGRYGI